MERWAEFSGGIPSQIGTGGGKILIKKSTTRTETTKVRNRKRDGETGKIVERVEKRTTYLVG